MSTRAEQLSRIPEAISREAYLALIEAALPGIDVTDLRSLTFGPESITAEVFARNAAGERFIADYSNVAVHQIAIPVVDGAEN